MLIHDATPLVKRSVLCVQPNEDYHPALQLALSKFRMLIVPNALEAIRAVNGGSFDSYVLDYWLPDWGGVSLCRQIRQSDPHAPVVFFTAADSPEQKRRAMRAGAQGYIFAPDGAVALGNKLRTLLQHGDLRAMRAKLEEEQAVQAELERRAALAIEQTAHAQERAAEALQRIAQARARKAFLEAGGTLATFDRWWPQTFGSAVANHRASVSTARDLRTGSRGER
jgi:DNA-binding response OmpR family regulator